MPELKAERSIAEKFLKEMVKADDTSNYDLFVKYYEEQDLVDFSPERFEHDIKHMQARNGRNVGYSILVLYKAIEMAIMTVAFALCGKAFTKNEKP